MAPSPMLAKYEVDREGVGGALAKKKKTFKRGGTLEVPVDIRSLNKRPNRRTLPSHAEL